MPAPVEDQQVQGDAMQAHDNAGCVALGRHDVERLEHAEPIGLSCAWLLPFVASMH